MSSPDRRPLRNAVRWLPRLLLCHAQFRAQSTERVGMLNGSRLQFGLHAQHLRTQFIGKLVALLVSGRSWSISRNVRFS